MAGNPECDSAWNCLAGQLRRPLPCDFRLPDSACSVIAGRSCLKKWILPPRDSRASWTTAIEASWLTNPEQRAQRKMAWPEKAMAGHPQNAQPCPHPPYRKALILACTSGVSPLAGQYGPLDMALRSEGAAQAAVGVTHRSWMRSRGSCGSRNCCDSNCYSGRNKARDDCT